MDYSKAYEYIEELYKNGSLKQKQYVENTEAEDFVSVVDDDVARMLQVLITLAKPKKILELGTSIGFSTVMMAKAAKDYGGKIVTIELDAEVARQAIKNFEREMVKDHIELEIGDARVVVSNMDTKFDFIFQDVGDKSLYFEMIGDYIRLLKTGGLLVAEDSLFPVVNFSHEFAYLAPMQKELDEFNRKIACCQQFESTLLPIGDGLTIAVKK